MVGDHDDSDILEIKRDANYSEVFEKQDVYHFRPTELKSKNK
jgi:hypothetical protein